MVCLKYCHLQEKSHKEPDSSPGKQEHSSPKPLCMKSTNSSSVCNFEEELGSADLGRQFCPHCYQDNELIFISSTGNSMSSTACTCAAAKPRETASWRRAVSSTSPQKVQSIKKIRRVGSQKSSVTAQFPLL